MALQEINSTNYMDYSFIIPYIRYCAEDKYRQAWELANRIIGDYEFVFITRGTGRFVIKGRVYNVKPNDLLLLKPDIVHSAVSLSLPFEFLCIHFDLYVNSIKKVDWVISESVPQKPIKYIKVVLEFPEYSTVENSSYINTVLKRIILESKSMRTGYNTLTKALFIDYLINLFRGSEAGREDKKYPKEIDEIIEFIDCGYMKKLYLADAASHVHLHHTYVSALFKKHMGITFSDYLTLKRLSAAKKLLLESDGKIDEIACKVGFCDLHHFSRVFKVHEGLSPSQYRQIRHW